MKSTLLSTICALFISAFSFGQTSTEQYETESNGSTSFTDNGVIFNIISNVNTYDIQAAYPNTGWNGTSIDNRYIDNSGSGNQSAGTSFSIKTTSNLFKVNRFLYCTRRKYRQIRAKSSTSAIAFISGRNNAVYQN